MNLKFNVNHHLQITFKDLQSKQLRHCSAVALKTKYKVFAKSYIKV